MTNLVTIIGRLNYLPTEREDGFVISIKVTRPYKNAEGEYDTDDIKCLLTSSMSKNVVEYCKVDDICGIKGHLEIRQNEMFVIVERLTFLSKKEEE